MSVPHHCLIDGSNFIHRAWAVATPRKRPSDGLEIGAAWLFSRMMAKFMRKMAAGGAPPTHAAIYFDPPRTDTWRRAEFPSYKANRPPTDPDLKA